MICLNSILLVFVNPRFHFKNYCKINCVTIIEKSSSYTLMVSTPNNFSPTNLHLKLIYTLLYIMYVVYVLCIVYAYSIGTYAIFFRPDNCRY